AEVTFIYFHMHWIGYIHREKIQRSWHGSYNWAGCSSSRKPYRYLLHLEEEATVSGTSEATMYISDPNRYSREAEDNESVDSMLMDVSTLRAATGDFAENNKLGEGGFGAVYKGTLPDGEEIAVKRLSKGSTQGVDELKNELALVAKLKHKNLVRLLGVCLEQQERLLVYEFVPNRSLDQILFIDIGLWPRQAL
uniref:Protein kinase domain-containing protein n=1 Tax=Aegilops tauschii subsp. strangulata TaxID=200361 RepID=A0A453T8L4_AEGTS